MEDQRLQSSHQIQVGSGKWAEKFLIKRINEEDIEITLQQRDEILRVLNDGQRFIQIGKYTLMLNGIKSIDPKYGAFNIPPRPKEIFDIETKENIAIKIILNQAELDEWDNLFKK